MTHSRTRPPTVAGTVACLARAGRGRIIPASRAAWARVRRPAEVEKKVWASAGTP